MFDKDGICSCGVIQMPKVTIVSVVCLALMSNLPVGSFRFLSSTERINVYLLIKLVDFEF